MSQPTLTLAGVRVKAGTRSTVQVPVAPLYTHTEMTLPVHVIHGRRPGPRLFVCGAVHGDEIIGMEIIRRLMRRKGLQSIRGTLLAIPVVNVYGFLQHSRYSPDRRDLNRFFPGSVKGSLTSQLAGTVMEELVRGSTHGIDLHAGSNHRTNLPQIRAVLDDPETLALAKAFKVPVVINAEAREGSLRQAAREMGIRVLLYEAGEALRFDETAIRAGARGIISVMQHIGMLSAKRPAASGIEPLIADTTSWVRTPISGILTMTVPLGSRVAKNSKIAEIADPFGEESQEIRSPVSGMVIGRLNMPLVHQGDAVIHIAHLDRLKGIAPLMEDFREEINDTDRY
ncbi:MAG: succinylglutamate desuccinylase/aspartoacylase family protein [Desulfobacterales bacterium]|jgi:predicted deacylase